MPVRVFLLCLLTFSYLRAEGEGGSFAIYLEGEPQLFVHGSVVENMPKPPEFYVAAGAGYKKLNPRAGSLTAFVPRPVGTTLNLYASEPMEGQPAEPAVQVNYPADWKEAILLLRREGDGFLADVIKGGTSSLAAGTIRTTNVGSESVRIQVGGQERDLQQNQYADVLTADLEGKFVDLILRDEEGKRVLYQTRITISERQRLQLIASNKAGRWIVTRLSLR